jgi:hypothetical protein
MEIKFDKCPSCGKTNRIAESISKEEIAKGNLDKEDLLPLLAVQVPIMNPNRKSKLVLTRTTVPIITAFFDICSDCGTLYAIRVITQSAPMEIQPNPKSSPLVTK